MTIQEFFEENIDFMEVNPRVEESIRKFISNNTEFFMSKGIDEHITFGKEREKSFVDMYRMDMTKFKAFRKGHPILTFGENVKNVFLLLMIMSYAESGRTEKVKITKSIQQDYIGRYVIEGNASTKIDEDNIKGYLDRQINIRVPNSMNPMFTMFAMFKVYTAKIAKYYKYGLSKERARYVIQNLMTNQDDIKSHDNILAVFNKKNNKFLEEYQDRFERMNDKDVLYLVNALVTRINNWINGIASKFYEEHRNGNIENIWEQKDVHNEETKITNDSETMKFDRLKEKTKMDLTTGVDRKIIKMAKMNAYPIDNIMEKDIDTLCDLVDITVSDYLVKYPTATIESSYNDLPIYIFSGRKKDERLFALSEQLAEKHNIKARSFRNQIREFVGLLIVYNLNKI